MLNQEDEEQGLESEEQEESRFSHVRKFGFSKPNIVFPESNNDLYCCVTNNGKLCSYKGFHKCMFCNNAVCLRHEIILHDNKTRVCKQCLTSDNDLHEIASGIDDFYKNKKTCFQIFKNKFSKFCCNRKKQKIGTTNFNSINI